MDGSYFAREDNQQDEMLHNHQQQQTESITTLTPVTRGLPPDTSSVPTTDKPDPEVIMFTKEWLMQLSEKMREVSSRMIVQRDTMMTMPPCHLGAESRHQERLFNLQVCYYIL